MTPATVSSCPTADNGRNCSTELAGPFGGDTDFYKLEVRSFWYFPGFLRST